MPSTYQKPTGKMYSHQSHRNPGHQYIRQPQNTLQTWALTQTTQYQSKVYLTLGWIRPHLQPKHQRLPWRWRSIRSQSKHGSCGTLQQKGRLPKYAHLQLLELQQKFDVLEALSVFKHREDINIPVEYLYLPFLNKKPSRGYHLSHCIRQCWSLQPAPAIAYSRCWLHFMSYCTVEIHHRNRLD